MSGCGGNPDAVIVGRDGDTVYVLTNNHVAGSATEIQIVLSDGAARSTAAQFYRILNDPSTRAVTLGVIRQGRDASVRVRK